MLCHLAKKVWVGKLSLSGLERVMLLPKFLFPHQGAPALENRNTKAVYYFLWLTVLKWESKNVSLIILFLYSWFDLEPRKLTHGINDIWGQTWVCGEKWDQTAGLYTNNPLAVLTSSLSALSPPYPGERKYKIFPGSGTGWRKSWECSHLHYWPSKSSRACSSQRKVVMATAESRSRVPFGHCLQHKVLVQLSTSWSKKHTQSDRYRGW